LARSLCTRKLRRRASVRVNHYTSEFAERGYSRAALNIVVLIGTRRNRSRRTRQRYSRADIVLELTARCATDGNQGFQVLQTRSSNENPSFDDRSALANAQTGAIFVSLHVSSTGLSGTVRAYTMAESAPQRRAVNSVDQAQASYLR